MFKDPVLTGAVWAQTAADAATEVDTSATSFTGGREIVNWLLEPGYHNIELPSNFGPLSENMHMQANGTDAISYSFVGKCLISGQTGQVAVYPTVIDI